jgi:tyrosyl-tRNA synthetase
VRWQSEWFEKFSLEDVFNLTSRFTMQQLLAHETFRKRSDEGNPVTIMELMYPLLQAYDSVAINADVEFGGMDQKFNILAGRELMRSLGMEPQQVLLVPLLVGTDGRKMSKSFLNTIDLTMPPTEMYGRVMAMSDDVIVPYFENVTDVAAPHVQEIGYALEHGTNPRDLKMRLARELVTQFHDDAAAGEAEDYFRRTVQRGEVPADMPEHVIAAAINIVDLLAESKLAPSKSEARRLIAGGGVRVNGEKVDQDAVLELNGASVVQVGKRKFVRVVPAGK